MQEPPTLRAPHIGIFDSGIGGLSVLRALRRQWPQARCTYIADSRFAPWGDRPAGWVVARCQQLTAHLLADGADLVLVACNTASTQAITALRQHWPDRLFVGVEPGIKPAAAASRNGRVAVLATTGTLASPRLAQLVAAHAGSAVLLHLPCPGLAEAIERAGADDAALHQHLDQIVAKLLAAEVDTVVLGCTHYPLVATALQARLGPRVRLVDTADAVARQVVRLLAAAHPVAAAPGAGPDHRAAALPRLLATGPLADLSRAARRWVQADALAEPLQLADPAPVQLADPAAVQLADPAPGARDGNRTRTPEGCGF